jgi:predicted nucleotidyltransferase
MITRDEIVKQMTKELGNKLGSRLKKLVLIGSMARGDETKESDYDCIAVIDELTPELTDILDEVSGDMLYKYNSVFSIIPVTQDRYQEQRFNPLFINAGREGVILWPTAI